MRHHFSMIPLAAVAITSAFGCHRQDTPEVQSLRWLEKADPVVDATTALAKGDHRLRAVYGLGVTIPGTDRMAFESFKQNYGINEIAGTTDALLNGEHGRLVQLAIRYAEIYNQHIIRAYKPKQQSSAA